MALRIAKYSALAWLVAAVACGPSPQPPGIQRAQYVRSCPPTPPIPPVARAIFDIYLGAAQATRVPSDSDVRAIERRGGRVLHRFHVDVIRAELDTGAARNLVSGPDPIALMATQVLDSTDLTVPLLIFYARPLTPDDSAFIARLTGRTGPSTRAPRPMMYTELPDSLVPLVLRAPGVQFARARTFGCAYDGGHAPAPYE